MTSWLTGMAMTAAVSFLAGWIVRAWKKNEATIVANVSDLDEWFERVTKIDLPDAWQAFYHQAILRAVAWVDTNVMDARMMRQIVRKIFSLSDPTKRDEFLAQLGDAVKKVEADAAKRLEDQLSPELLEIVNNVKAEQAVRIAEAKIVPTIPAEAAAEIRPSKIERDVHVAAQGADLARKAEPVTGSVFDRLVRESQARQAAMAK